MELEDLFKDRSNEGISNFAHNLGRLIEDTINIKSNQVGEENKILRAKILDFRNKLDRMNNSENLIVEYDKHFGITLVESNYGSDFLKTTW